MHVAQWDAAATDAARQARQCRHGGRAAEAGRGAADG